MKNLMERLGDLSVDVNGVMIPARSLQMRLSRHAVSLVVNNLDPVYKLSLVGSATAIRFADRHLLVCSAHQLNGSDWSQVSMLLDNGDLVTTAGLRSYVHKGDGEEKDIFAFDFTEPVAAYPELSSRFFHLRDVPPPTPHQHVLMLLLAGYPSEIQQYDIEENNHIGLRKLTVVCEPLGLSADPAALIVRPVEPLINNPDGMSGGSAFMVRYESGQMRAYFSGIILRGGKDRFYVMHPGAVLQLLQSWT